MADRIISIARVAIGLLSMLASSSIACEADDYHASAFTPAEIQQIIDGLPPIRGLKFKNKVSLKFLAAAEVIRLIKGDDDREHQAQAALNSKVGAMLGLFPTGTNVQSAELSMLRDEIAGLYDFRKKQMIIIERSRAHASSLSEAKRRQATDVIAHELTHALQDQNFGVGAALEKAQDDDDRALALGSVAEGDATLSGFAYIAGRMDNEVLDTFLKYIPEMEKAFAKRAQGVPLGIREPFLFQYMEGARFVAAAYRRGGWPAVDALYHHPPESSQQILHPAAYFAHPTAPAPQVHVAGYEPGLKQWKKINEGTFGEELLRVIIEANLGEHSARALLAKAWDGDRLIVMQKGGALTILWVVAFVSEAAAANFAQIYETALDKLHGSQTPHRVDRNARAVLVMVGDGAKRSNDLVAQIFKKTTLSGEPLAD